MPNFKITLQRSFYRSQFESGLSAPADSTVVIYRDKNTVKGAYDTAHEIALDLFGTADGEGKVVYSVEEIPAA